ncbi:P22 coat protein - protein 5 domain protein [Streptomyces mirabilis]|uniref:P22 phage major capsid protein family protein n=1 Tax=Streptomyces mirabilis TaxID=68239 RepID=UPI002E283C60|nr:P22 phage major capsid protein family protein [Streptomyces mirabilis]
MVFKPEIWAAQALVSLRKSLVYAGPQVVNHDYEGEIKKVGDTVHIKMLGDVTVRPYTGADITYDDIADAEMNLKVDQADYFGFEVDDVDKAQAGDEMAKRTDAASWKMAEKVDSYVAGLYTQVQSANVLSTVNVTTGDIAYNSLVDLKVRLDECNVQTTGRYVIVPSWYHGLLLKSPNFINAEKAADNGQALRNGQVGRAAGFDILMSNAVPIITGNDYAVMAGVSDAISFADQVNQMETMRLPNKFATVVRGLHVYGAKVIRPDALAVLTASRD